MGSGDGGHLNGSYGWGVIDSGCERPNWGDSPRWGDGGESTKSFKSLGGESVDTNRMLMEDNEDLRQQNKRLKISLKFLRHKFDQEPTLPCFDGYVTIIVQGAADDPLTANKFILASRSPVFRKIFETLYETTLHIDQATLPVVRAVINYCYTAQIRFTEEVSSEEVLEVAHRYAIGPLKQICGEDLTAELCTETLPKLLKMAKKFKMKSLEDVALSYFKMNFDEVIYTVLSEIC